MLATVSSRGRPSTPPWCALLLAVSALAAAPPARAGSETCAGVAPTSGCTVNGVVGPCVGTDGADRIEGTDGDDVIIAGGSDDVVRSGAGDDRICGDDGDDDLRKTGTGRVEIDGGAGRDRIRGGASDDVLFGGTEDDKIAGGKGSDTILCGQGRSEKANGGPGEDACQCARKGKCERTPSPLPPPVTSTTIPAGATTTLVVATTSTMSSTSTTLCVPRTCGDAGVECGGVDDGCGGFASCAPCPIDRPLCIEGTCKDSCAESFPFERCDSDGSECTLEYCIEGVCELASVTQCSPGPCHTSASCNPTNGACEGNGYLGDLTACQHAPGEPLGRCASGECAVGKECVIDGVAYDTGDKDPANPCQACQPGLARAQWTMVDNGKPCPGGLCANQTCSSNACFIGYQLRNAGDVNPDNTCQSCIPDLNRSGWSPVPDGKPCPSGFCVAGTCDDLACFIDGLAHANGARNPAQPCQACDVSKSRTSWITLPDLSSCGKGCRSGHCEEAFGGCVYTGGGCLPRACSSGLCNDDGVCVYFPVGAEGDPCTEFDATGCVAAQGTCHFTFGFGVCQRQIFPGSACTPQPTANLCISSTNGTCDSLGNCVPELRPGGTSCTPLNPAPCRTYSCDSLGHCLNGERGCPSRPDLENCFPRCNPQTNACEYTANYPSGTQTCSSPIRACCDDQFCASPPECGDQFCFMQKRCYAYGSYIPP